MEDWTQADQDEAVAERRRVSEHMVTARRKGRRGEAWFWEKLADFVLWIEREGRRLKRVF